MPDFESFYKLLNPVNLALVTMVTAPAIAILISFRRFLREKSLAIADAIQFLLGKQIDFTISAAASMRQYCRASLGSPQTAVLPVPGDDRVLKTDEAFVTLSLEGADERIFNNRSLLEAGTRLRIIGDPGSGKSSLVKRIFRDACRDGLSSPKSAALPILIELKSLRAAILRPEASKDWLWQYCADQISELHGFNMTTLLQRYAETGRLLILLDGLDEVSADTYKQTCVAINELSDRLGAFSAKHTVILTMREQFHQQSRNDFVKTFPDVLTVKRFSSSDIYEFLLRWFKAAPSASASAAQVHSELAAHPSVRDLCRNPLVLAMYVANFLRVRKHQLPDTRTRFYADVTSELLINRRAEQLNEGQARIAARRQRETILGILALENMLDPAQSTNSLSWQRAIEVVRERTIAKNDEEASSMLLYLAKETGLFSQEREGESFRFIHRSFCEYFAAFEAARGENAHGWQPVMQRHLKFHEEPTMRSSSRLEDVIAFTAALVPTRTLQLEAIAAIGQMGDAPLMGRTLLETQAYDQPIWPQYAHIEKMFLRSADAEDWDSMWLQRLHLFQAVCADAARAAEIFIRPASGIDVDLTKVFSDLVQSDRKRLHILFASYVSEGASAAFDLAGAVGLDLPLEAPELVITAMKDDLPFLYYCLEKASVEPTGRVNAWAPLMVEAALRSRLVADVMAETPAPVQWAKFAAASSGKRRWHLALPRVNGAPSYYDAAIAIAIGDAEPRIEEAADVFTMVPALRLMGRPRSTLSWYKMALPQASSLA